VKPKSLLALQVKTPLIAILCAGLLAATAGAADSTKGREVVPLTPEFKPGDYVWNPEVSLAGPVVIIVSIPEQTMFVYRNGVPIGRSSVSTGKKGHATPTGLFTILQKKVDHGSSTSKGAKMPPMQGVTWSGIALHAGNLPGYPPSHGCVRLPLDFAAQLDTVTSNSTSVILTDQKHAPGATATPGLLLGGKTGGAPAGPLPPGGFEWQPQKSPKGAVAIIFSTPDATAYVYRNGVQIGRSTFVLDKSEHIHGSHAYHALAGVDAEGRHNWLATTSIGGGEAPDVKALAARTAIPSAILEKVRAIIVPGTTLIISDLPVSRRTQSKPGFGILTATSAR